MKNYVFVSLLLLGMISCSKEEMSSPASPPSTEETVTPISPTIPTVSYTENNSDYIFDQDQLYTYELTLPSAELAKIDSDPAAEQYVEGSLTFQGQTLDKVGIRYKGSIGAFVGCLTGNNWARPSGSKTCTKLSMKIKINWGDKDAKFYGLKKLQFHSQNNDDSQMHDRLGYWLYREMGVPAPRAVHAKLFINGSYIGLFSLVEQIDGRFTRYHYEDGKGNLYKEIWPLRSDGQLFPDRTYLEHLKTNEDENPSLEMMKSFAQDIRDAEASNLVEVIDKWMDTEEIMAYIAVDRAIRNDDGAFHWYCGGGPYCAPHNFYWYEHPTDRTMHLIPWDLDNAFENILADVNPVTPIADDWGEISNNCQPFGGFVRQRSAACDKLTGGWAAMTEAYQNKKNALVQGPLSENAVTQQLDKWVAQIEGATQEAAQLHSDAISVQRWKRAVDLLRRQLETARKK